MQLKNMSEKMHGSGDMNCADLINGEKRQILIVEDEPEIANFMKGLLADSHALTIVHDGRSAIENIESKDVVVLDYRLPDMSGLEVLRKIKRLKPNLPVIFMTAYGDEEVAVKAFRYGVKDYLKKPFNYNRLLLSLNSCLSLAHMDKREPRRVLIDDADTVSPGIIEAINNSAIKYNLQKAVIFINNNYMNKITLDKVAHQACTSRHHFSREFKKALGCTYKDYVNTVRIEKARELLKNTVVSITEAAYAVGYPDLTNFERIFKKIVGCTPKEYKGRQQTGFEKSE